MSAKEKESAKKVETKADNSDKEKEAAEKKGKTIEDDKAQKKNKNMLEQGDSD